MGVISWLVFGLIAGMLARFLMPGEGPKGCIITVVLGIAGAAVGGWIGTQLDMGGVDEFDFRSLGLAVLGSMILLLAYQALRGRQTG